jgi:hypothetical protein
MPRRALGVLLIFAAAAGVALGYANAATAASCDRINDFDRALGLGAACSTTPSLGYFAVGAVLAIAGALVIIPWCRRLVED